MRRIAIFICMFLPAVIIHAQELFVFSEPASNMPASSMAAKLVYRTPVSNAHTGYKQRYTPEIMFGLSRKWMLHLSSSFSDFYTSQTRWESLKTYAKYRFFSNDDVHRHFRMAAFAEVSYSRSPFLYPEISLDGDNSGVQAGIIATQLAGKLAVSGTASVIKVLADRRKQVDYLGHSLHGIYYSLSAGYLLFPLNYSNYRQTNLNVYLETLGMKGFEQGDYMIDLAPSLQLIFNSNFKINLGARLELGSNMDRIGRYNYFIGLENTFLGILRRPKKRPSSP